MRSRVLGLALVLASSTWASGCCLGAVSRWDGEWPLDPSLTRDDVHLGEVGGGEDGVLCQVRGHGGKDYVLATSDSVKKLTFEGSLEGALVQGDCVYRIEKDAIVRRRIQGSTLSAPTTLAAVPGARILAVLAGTKPDEETIAVGTGDSVVLVRNGKAREVWQGEAYALTLSSYGRLWVAGKSLPVIDLVRLGDGQVLARVPLPLELESPSLRIIPSGESVIVYAHDRPLESAVLITPSLGIASALRGTWGPSASLVAHFDRDADPPLLVPAGKPVGTRLALGGDPGHVFGRVAPLPGSRFLLVADSAQASQLAVAIISSTTSPEVALQRSTLKTPEGWSGTVEAVGWDAHGVVLASGTSTLRVGPGGACDLDDPRSGADLARRSTNTVLNGIVATVEVGVSFPAGAFLGALVAPFGALLLAGTPILIFVHPVLPLAGLLGVLAPVWFPFFHI